MPHDGRIPRPTERYFTVPSEARSRRKERSQGDIFSPAPIWRPPLDALDPWDTTTGTIMLLSNSCRVDYPDEELPTLHVAPVVPVEGLELGEANLKILTEEDCLHHYMYLPAEAGFPERVVQFERAGQMRLELLMKLPRQSQLTLTGTRQLMRKITMFFTSAHDELQNFKPTAKDFPDDFPGGSYP